MCDDVLEYQEYKWYDKYVWKIKDILNWIKYKFVKPPKSNLIKHAEVELALSGYIINNKDKNDINSWVVDNVIELLTVFSKQGHSGMSAPYVSNLFKLLANYEILTPLSGDDNEWCEYTTGKYQNIRCGHVFKDEDGLAYDSEGRIFREPDGCCFTNRDSRVYITFPYTPKREYVDVEKE